MQEPNYQTGVPVDSLKLNLFGITIGIFSRFEELAKFADEKKDAFSSLFDQISKSID